MIRFPQIEVKLSGEDGNIFLIMGRVIEALRVEKVSDADRLLFKKEITEQESYEKALAVVQRWVRVK